MCLSQGPDGYPGSVGESGIPGIPGEKVPDKLPRKIKLTFKSQYLGILVGSVMVSHFVLRVIQVVQEDQVHPAWLEILDPK